MNSGELADCIYESISDITRFSRIDTPHDTQGSTASLDITKSSSSTSQASFDGNTGGGAIVSASSGTASGVDLADNFGCPICHALLFRPVRPSCRHLFCRFCLILWMDKCTKNQLNSVCPMCRVGLGYPEALPVDAQMEQEIISQVGLESYQLRHKDVVKEKIERVVVDSELEHQNEITQNFYSTIQFGARAGILGTAFAGPVGAVAALGAVGAYAAYMQVVRLKREDRRKFGLVEDDATAWIQIAHRHIQVTNMTLTKVNVELYDNDGLFPLACRSFEPYEIGAFVLDPIQGPETQIAPADNEEHISYSLRIALPGFVEKELASGPAVPGHGYLFCCTDTCVQEDPIDTDGRYLCTDGLIEISNHSLVTVNCKFYSTSIFPDTSIILEPDARIRVTLPKDVIVATVQVCAASDSFFVADTELCSVQMRQGYAYRILESRIKNLDDAHKENEESVGDWIRSAFLIDLDPHPL